MTERKDVKIRRKPRPEENKETASTGKKKKRWKKRHKKPVDLNKRLEELQAHINGEYHAP